MLHRPSILTISTFASLLLLSACDSSTGGGAGDGDDNLDAVELLAPLTGLYELEDGWKGETGDRGILVIETPGAEGTSVAELYDYDDIGNCVPTRPSTGVVSKDPFGDRIFMDDILQFDDAVLTLSGSVLTIEFSDEFDIDNDSETSELSITANKLGLSQISDVGDEC